MNLEGLRNRAIGAVERLVVAVDNRIAGDGGASVKLTPEQQAQMTEWFEVTLPALKRNGVDTSWGDSLGK